MFFKAMPRIGYKIDGKSVSTKDIFRRVGLDRQVNSRLALQSYYIKDGETPDIVANNIYGSSKYHWVILIVNDIVNPYEEWPKTQNEIFEYTEAKYGVGNATADHHYRLKSDTSIIVDYDVDALTGGVPADPEYNNGAISNVVGDGSDFFKREVTTNGVRIMGAGTVGGQTAVPDAWLEKVARMFELFTDPNGAGINQTDQRNLIKNLSGDIGTYHAGKQTIQRVARGAGADYSPNFLTDSGIESWNLSPLFDSTVQNDMVWYLNSTGDGYGDGDIDAQEVIEHVFHTLHMHGLPADDIKLYSFLAADWQTGDLYAAMEEAYDAGKWDPSGYQENPDDWKTIADSFEVAAKEYLFLLNFAMFEYTELWDGGSLAPEWTDDMRTQAGIQANNPLGYAFHNTYIAPAISKPSLATIRSIFQDGNTPAQDNPALAGASGYIVDALSDPTIEAVSNIDFELDLNESKKQIFLLNSNYLAGFITNYKNLMAQ